MRTPRASPTSHPRPKAQTPRSVLGRSGRCSGNEGVRRERAPTHGLRPPLRSSPERVGQRPVPRAASRAETLVTVGEAPIESHLTQSPGHALRRLLGPSGRGTYLLTALVPTAAVMRA